MAKLRTVVTLAASLAASNALADQTFLVCKITQTVDDKGAVEATTGTDVFVIAPQPNGSITYTLPPGCQENTIVAKITNTEMMFECARVATKGFEYLMTINRVSGEYTKIFSKKGSGSGLVEFGHCAPSKQQF